MFPQIIGKIAKKTLELFSTFLIVWCFSAERNIGKTNSIIISTQSDFEH